MSIAHGFAYAGCPSLVISLWRIGDRTSAQVMKRFYYHISEGIPIDHALAMAKSDYILGTNEFNSHPFYWAAYLQVGNPQELDIKKPNWWGWVLVGGLMIMVAVVVYLKKFRVTK